MENQAAVLLLSALAHACRLAVFRLLIQAGPQGMPALSIAEALKIPPSSLSFHLKELHRAGIVTQTRISRSLWYAVDFDTVNRLLAFLTEDCCSGNPCTPVRIPACPPRSIQKSDEVRDEQKRSKGLPSVSGVREKKKAMS